MNTDFEMVIAPNYRHTYPFQNGFALVGNTDWEWTYVARDGREVSEFKYGLHQPLGNHKPRHFTEGRAVVFDDGKFSFIDETGTERVPFTLTSATDFLNGYLSGKIDGKWGAYDTEGNVVVPFEYDSLGFFHSFD